MTVNTEEFDWQLGYLQQHYNPITFQQFARQKNESSKRMRNGKAQGTLCRSTKTF
jgi:hypothetical protein